MTDLDMEVCYDDGESGEDPKCMAYDMSQDRRRFVLDDCGFVSFKIFEGYRSNVLANWPPLACCLCGA